MTFLTPSVTGEIYHVFTRSIAQFTVFRKHEDYRRAIDLLAYYLLADLPVSFSKYIPTQEANLAHKKRVQVIAYCVMPTHIHLVVKQLAEDGIRFYMNTVLNSYTQYFNKKYNRKGPLWESRFRRVLVNSDEQLIHLTRYVHLNPVTAALIDRPEAWEYSSYWEYLHGNTEQPRISDWTGLLDIRPEYYQKFVNDGMDYYRKKSLISEIILEEEAPA
jgi:putative transposase